MPWNGRVCFSERVLVEAVFETSNASRYSVLEA